LLLEGAILVAAFLASVPLFIISTRILGAVMAHIRLH
jgi:hypothetical protein